MLRTPESRNNHEVIVTPNISISKTVIAHPPVIEIYLSKFPLNQLITYHDRDGRLCLKNEAKKATMIILEGRRLAKVIDFNVLTPEKLVVDQYGDTEEEIISKFNELKKELEIIEAQDERLAIPSEEWLNKMETSGMPVESPLLINYRFQNYPKM